MSKAPKSTGPKSKPQKPAVDVDAVVEENAALKAELDDLKLLYEATIEHGEAVEDQLADQSARLQGLSRQLAKYLSPQVYQSIFEGRQEVKIASTRKKLTVFFSDIADFTETADRLESEELTGILNQYLTEMSQIALKHGATIDKFVGDAILIFFGDPESRGVHEDALACVNMAIEMQNRMTELQDTWKAAGISKPLRCRMGIHTDYCTVGNFGSEDRLDYTIIGRGVNTAARLESLAQPGAILVSYETYCQVNDQVECREKGEVTVKGIAYPVTVYEVVGGKKAPSHDEDTADLLRRLDDLAAAPMVASDERARLAAALRTALARLEDGSAGA